jgi:hypothetical protein
MGSGIMVWLKHATILYYSTTVQYYFCYFLNEHYYCILHCHLSIMIQNLSFKQIAQT